MCHYTGDQARCGGVLLQTARASNAVNVALPALPFQCSQHASNCIESVNRTSAQSKHAVTGVGCNGLAGLGLATVIDLASVNVGCTEKQQVTAMVSAIGQHTCQISCLAHDDPSGRISLGQMEVANTTTDAAGPLRQSRQGRDCRAYCKDEKTNFHAQSHLQESI